MVNLPTHIYASLGLNESKSIPRRLWFCELEVRYDSKAQPHPSDLTWDKRNTWNCETLATIKGTEWKISQSSDHILIGPPNTLIYQFAVGVMKGVPSTFLQRRQWGTFAIIVQTVHTRTMHVTIYGYICTMQGNLKKKTTEIQSFTYLRTTLTTLRNIHRYHFSQSS